MEIIIFTIAGLVVGFIISFLISKATTAPKIHEAALRISEQKGQSIISDAEKTAENNKREKLLEVKEECSKLKIETEAEVQRNKQRIQNAEKQLKQKEQQVEQKLQEAEKLRKEAESIREEATKIQKGQMTKLEKIAQMSKEEARKTLLDTTKNELKLETAKLINAAREEVKLKSNQEAQSIVLTAIQRSATDYCTENTVSVVALESDEMKGRIIGREGRNIRAFEAVTGVDLIIDDTPEAVVISSFDPVRREIARRALAKLIHDGRIHPSRIEELVEKAKKELDEEMLKEGENAIITLGIHNMHNELMRAVGKMKYRTSYGQNLLNHSMEVAYIAGIISSELNLDPRPAKRASLLHDIGKIVDKEVEGPHAKLGGDLAKKYKENDIIVNAVAAHHGDIDHISPYATIVQIADGISGARPGARKESIENYIKRLEKLEDIATSFEGVNKTFAIQAGREIRVIVEPEKIDDVHSNLISSEIAKRIESEMEYPGQIKVTVIREKRSVSIAK